MLTPTVAPGMTKAGEAGVVFLLDIDNTLLDNDRFSADLGERLQQDFGTDGRNRYWTLYASVREVLGYADYLATLQQFRAGLDDDPDLLQMSGFMLGDRLTTVFVRQGHYAREAVGQLIVPPPDLTIERISELAGFDLQRFGLQRFGQP